TPRTLSAPRSPKPQRSSQKKKGKVIEESSELRKPLRIKLTTKRPDPIIPVPTYSEVEYDQLTEAQQVSIAATVNAKELEEKENVATVEKAIMAEEVNKLVKGDEEKESFIDYLLINQENPNTRLKPESRKESPTEKVNDDDGDDQHNNDALIRMKKKRSSDIREKEKQTPIPTPSRSPRTNVSLDKEQTNVHMSNFHPNPNPSMQNISQV
ncbi:hypothetical protein Tco_0181524, partial [Tanacetum coccineum]